MTGRGILKNLKHTPRAVGPKKIPRGQFGGLLVIEGPAIRNDFCNIALSTSYKVAYLTSFGIDDHQLLALLHDECHPQCVP
jgi:hypothetical protein